MWIKLLGSVLCSDFGMLMLANGTISVTVVLVFLRNIIDDVKLACCSGSIIWSVIWCVGLPLNELSPDNLLSAFLLSDK
ncbi:protein of unknown function [Moritella yayanosii]|uniref:Uncharacterized protein n=1 Tax=Moritella yayanosii TaxID=69539 RepID=A0A330LTH5_9GAMM|nr:protein of unknown function [Moritella yayanosii]